MVIWQEPMLALVLGYLLGSIPFGLVLTRLFGAGDLRQIGSGNIGATNVLRTGRKSLAAGTLLLDMAKGLVAVIAARAMDDSYAVLGAAGAFFGHLYPIWLRFRGGKGVATLLGVSFGLNWGIGLAAALSWIAALAVSRISSVGGMVAAVAAPFAALALGQSRAAILLVALALMVILKHRDNIRRLRAGTEPRIGRGNA